MKPYNLARLPLKKLDWVGIVQFISHANRSLAHYDGILQGVINPQILLSPLTTQEAVLSSRIEGTQATLEQVFELEVSPGRNSETTEIEKDVQEIINYRRALQEAVGELEERPLSLNLIRKIHFILLSSVRGKDKARGKFRRKQNWIGKPGASKEEASYIPPTPRQVNDLMSNLEKYIHKEEKDPLVQLAIVHAQFELIHPFLDGNGRVGRILIPLFL